MALNPTAFLVFNDEVHFVNSPKNPVSTLLESIWESDPHQARIKTRSRIFHFQKLNPICQGMLKVSGKRSTLLSKIDFESLFKESISNRASIAHQLKTFFLPSPIPLPDHVQSLDEAMKLAISLSSHSDSKIAALILDESLRIRSWGWNDHFLNRTLHAETMAIKNYIHLYSNKIPKSYHLVTTLQPCAMCAGYLHEYCDDFSSLMIWYHRQDPGPFAQNSILVEGSDLHQKSGLIKTPSITQL